jgi:hypothetical protein
MLRALTVFSISEIKMRRCRARAYVRIWILTMSNYGFWLKTLLNKISGKQLFLNEHEHYCVHSPTTLTEEIRSFVNNIEVHTVIADSIYLPNFPGKISPLYFSLDQVYSLNLLVYKMIHSVSKNKYLGATMIVVFKKIAV